MILFVRVEPPEVVYILLYYLLHAILYTTVNQTVLVPFTTSPVAMQLALTLIRQESKWYEQALRGRVWGTPNDYMGLQGGRAKTQKRKKKKISLQ